MPEIISKYPEITIRVLEDGGARCGAGEEPQILKTCPRERFCSLPTGEICVYGLNEIPRMTQITQEEIARVVTDRLPEPRAAFLNWEIFLFVLVAFILGLILGQRFLRRK